MVKNLCGQLLTLLNWSFYHKGAVNITKPEIILTKIILPDNIKSVYIYGCATCEDFGPFENKYELKGFDIVDYKEIKFYKELNNFSYIKQSFQEFEIQDLSNVFVFTSVSLGCISKKEQEEFFEKLLKSGCNNIIFQEYKPGAHSCDFKLDEKEFEIKHISNDNNILTYVYKKSKIILA